MLNAIMKLTRGTARLRYGFACFCLTTVLNVPSFAQESESSKATAETVPSDSAIPAGDSRSAPEIFDVAFDRYVSFALLGRAINEQDAGSLADAGLQLSEGERILGRPAKAKGITAERILLMSYEMALDAKDDETIARLKIASTKLQFELLTNAIAASETLGGESRTLSQNAITPESMTTEVFHAFKHYIYAIQRARLLRDIKSLRSVMQALKGEQALPNEQLQRVTALATSVQVEIEKNPSADDDALLSLADASRGWTIGGPTLPLDLYPSRLKAEESFDCPFCNGSGHVASPLHPLKQSGSRAELSLDGAGGTLSDSSMLEGESRGFGWVARPQDWGKNGIQILPTPKESYSHFGDPEYLKIRLINETSWTIAYSLNGYSKPRLEPHSTAVWNFQGNTENPPSCEITFDAGRGVERSYNLDGRTQRFKLRSDKTLDLYHD